MQIITDTFIVALPSLLYLGVLVALIIFVNSTPTKPRTHALGWILRANVYTHTNVYTHASACTHVERCLSSHGMPRCTSRGMIYSATTCSCTFVQGLIVSDACQLTLARGMCLPHDLPLYLQLRERRCCGLQLRRGGCAAGVGNPRGAAVGHGAAQHAGRLPDRPPPLPGHAVSTPPRGPALRCALVCTHDTFTKGRSTYSRCEPSSIACTTD